MGSSDFLNKLIGAFIAFAILVVGPISTIMFSQQLSMERAILNEMTALIDKVTDVGQLHPNELADFKLAVSSQGAVVSVELSRYMAVVVPDGAGGTKTIYQLHENTSKFNKGDIFQVRVKALDYTGIQKVIYRLTSLITPVFDKTLAGRVRN